MRGKRLSDLLETDNLGAVAAAQRSVRVVMVEGHFSSGMDLIPTR